MSVFESFKNPATKTQIAVHLAEEAIQEFKQARKGREEEVWNDADTDLLHRLGALLLGPHRAAVEPIILKTLPWMAGLIESPPDPQGTA